MKRRLVTGVVALALLATSPVLAGFGAADLIYIPVASHSPGAVGSQWRTDLYLLNADDVDVDMAIAYLPSGNISNSVVFSTRDTWLGGREDDSFGYVNEALADIPPNGTVVLSDIIGDYWLDALGSNGNGSLVVFVYEAGSLEPDGTRVDALGIANARIYNDSTVWIEDPDNEGEFIERPAEYGQTMPGVPWYNLADGGAVGDDYDLSFEVLTGGAEGNGRRYNVGMVNASDPLTILSVLVQPFQQPQMGIVVWTQTETG